VHNAGTERTTYLRSWYDGVMKYRKLRIAWSIAWGIACLLLIALWGESYRYRYTLVGKANSQMLTIDTLGGRYRLMHCASAHSAWNELMGDDTFVFRCREYHETSGLVDEWQQARLALGFGWGRDVISETIYIPQWFTLLISALFAVVPWIKWSRRFSLRTLLIAMTLVAVGLGAIVYVLRS